MRGRMEGVASTARSWMTLRSITQLGCLDPWALPEPERHREQRRERGANKWSADDAHFYCRMNDAGRKVMMRMRVISRGENWKKKKCVLQVPRVWAATRVQLYCMVICGGLMSPGPPCGASSRCGFITALSSSPLLLLETKEWSTAGVAPTWAVDTFLNEAVGDTLTFCVLIGRFSSSVSCHAAGLASPGLLAWLASEVWASALRGSLDK